MGTDTKGRIVNCKKDAFEVADVIRDCVRKLQKRNDMHQKDKFFKIEIGHGNLFVVDFGFINKNSHPSSLEKRTLYVLFDCDTDWDDRLEMAGSGLCLTLGMWGSSEYLMKNLCLAISNKLGGVSFVDVNDCDNEGPLEIDPNDPLIEKDPIWVF